MGMAALFTWVNVFLSKVYPLGGGMTSVGLRDGITYFSRQEKEARQGESR